MSNANNNFVNAADDLKAAQYYVDRLLDDGGKIPVDESVAATEEMRLPEWYNEKQFKRAQKYYHDNIFGMFSGKLFGLLAVLTVPSILRVLVSTDGSSSPLTAYRRYMETIFHTMSWYDEDLKPGTRSWRSLAAVRKRHVSVSLRSGPRGSGIISQKDMALTQFGFAGFILLRPQMLGIQVSRANHEALVHFWRVIGHMMGIHDEYNLMTDSWTTTRTRLQLVLDGVYRPLMHNSTAEFYRMADYLITGLWCFNPFLNTQAYVHYMKSMSGCPEYVYFGSDPAILNDEALTNDGKELFEVAAENLSLLDWIARWKLWLMVTIFGNLLNFSWVRWYLNQQIYVSIVIIRWFPFLAIYAFGVRQAYVRVLGERLWPRSV